MTDYLLFAGLVLMSAGGLVLAALQLPGNWVILASAAAYDAWHGWSVIGWKWLVALTAFAAAVEVVEMLAGAFVAQKAGASRRAAVGAIVGGLVGMFALTVPIPLPVVGTIAGGLAGCFLGALAGELTLRDDLTHGARVGLFAVAGRLLGMLIKTSSAVVVAGATLSLAAWPLFLA